MYGALHPDMVATPHSFLRTIVNSLGKTLSNDVKQRRFREFFLSLQMHCVPPFQGTMLSDSDAQAADAVRDAEAPKGTAEGPTVRKSGHSSQPCHGHCPPCVLTAHTHT